MDWKALVTLALAFAAIAGGIETTIAATKRPNVVEGNNLYPAKPSRKELYLYHIPVLALSAAMTFFIHPGGWLVPLGVMGWGLYETIHNWRNM